MSKCCLHTLNSDDECGQIHFLNMLHGEHVSGGVVNDSNS